MFAYGEAETPSTQNLYIEGYCCYLHKSKLEIDGNLRRGLALFYRTQYRFLISIEYTSQKYDINVLVLPLCETRYELKKMWASIQPTFVFSLLLVGACNATAKKAGSSSPAHFSLKLMLKLMLTVTLMCKMYKATARYSTLGALISG